MKRHLSTLTIYFAKQPLIGRIHFRKESTESLFTHEKSKPLNDPEDPIDLRTWQASDSLFVTSVQRKSSPGLLPVAD